MCELGRGGRILGVTARVTRPKQIRDNVVAPLLLLSVVTVTLSF